MKKLLAISATSDERYLFEQLAELFSQLFQIDLASPSAATSDLSLYTGQLVITQPALAGLPVYRLPATLTLEQASPTELVTLAGQLTQFVATCEQFPLHHLPLHVAINQPAQQLLYHNGRPKDPFLFDDIDDQPIDDWIVKAIKDSPSHSLHLLLPSTSFEQILIHSYQGLYQQGQLTGIFQQVQDIKPMLASYLKETGQALVGWSDTVSGASIKNDTFGEDIC